MGRKSVDRMLDRLREASGVYFTNHRLRHSFTYHFNKLNNNDLSLSKEAARHSNIQTTILYTLPSEDDLVNGLIKLDEFF